MIYPYLIFVIFFTQAKFLENKIYTEIYTVKLRTSALISRVTDAIE